MVIGAHLGLGYNKYGDIVEAAEKANAIREPVYFELDTRFLYKKPEGELTDEDCNEQCRLPATFGGLRRLEVKGELRGVGPACIPKPRDKSDVGDHSIHRCVFDRAAACLTTLYQAWADCVFDWPGIRLYQCGHVSSILCDSCMNKRLGRPPGNAFLANEEFVPLNCFVECEAPSRDGCRKQAGKDGDACMEVCEQEYLTCSDNATTKEAACVNACDSTHTACIAQADQAYQPCLDDAGSEHADCVSGCGLDVGCIDGCNTALDQAITLCGYAFDQAATDCLNAHGECAGECQNDEEDDRDKCTDTLLACNEKCSDEFNEAEIECVDEVEKCTEKCEEKSKEGAQAADDYRNTSPGGREKETATGSGSAGGQDRELTSGD